jgi:hypothetical protein
MALGAARGRLRARWQHCAVSASARRRAASARGVGARRRRGGGGAEIGVGSGGGLAAIRGNCAALETMRVFVNN